MKRINHSKAQHLSFSYIRRINIFKHEVMKQTGITLIVALFVAFFYSCKDTGDLTNSIPASAATVIHIDTKSLLTKADYKPLENKVIKEALDKAKSGGNATKAIEQLESFLKNPNSTGIDFLSDCYMYMDSTTMGIVLKMDDQKKLKELLIKTFELPEQMLEEKDGVTTVSAQQNFVIGWTKDKLLLLTYMGTVYYRDQSALPDLKTLVTKQLTQTAKESINSKKSFAEFISNKKDISIFSSYSNIKGMWSSLLPPALAMQGHDGNAVNKMLTGIYDQLKDINTAAFISFEKGEIAFSNKMYYDTPEAEKKFNELASQMTGKLKGDQLKYFTDKPIFSISANMKGEGIYNYLNELGFISLIEENAGSNLSELGIDLKSFISNMDGDITFAVNNVKIITKKAEYYDFEYTDSSPELSFFADLKDANSIWNIAKGKIKELNGEAAVFTELNPNTYSLKMDENTTAYFGINNNMFFFTNSESIFKNISATGLKSDLSDQAKDKTAFICGTFSPLKPLLLSEMGGNDKAKELATKGFDLLGDYNYITTQDMSGSGKIVITDTSGNSLAVICKFVDSVVTHIAQEY